MKMPFVQVISNEPPRGIPDWIDNPYILCEELFPDWNNAKDFLKEVCNLVSELTVNMDTVQKSANFGINTLDVFNLYDLYYVKKLDEKLVKRDDIDNELMIVHNIMIQLISDYMPDDAELEKLYRRPINNESLYRAKQMIKSKENHIVCCGGRPFHEELKFRLGVLYG